MESPECDLVAAHGGVPGGVSARAATFLATDVPAPMVKVDGWPQAMPANDISIRCAILTAERRDPKGRYRDLANDVIVYAADGRALQTMRLNKGWAISLSHDGKIIDRVAARHGSKHDRPRPASYLGRIFAGKEMFSWQETENIMKQFVTSPGDPASVSWVGKRKR